MMNHREDFFWSLLKIIIQINSSYDDFSLMSSRLQVVIIVNEQHKQQTSSFVLLTDGQTRQSDSSMTSSRTPGLFLIRVRSVKSRTSTIETKSVMFKESKIS